MNKYFSIASVALLAACTPGVDGEQAIADMTARTNWATDSLGSHAIVARFEQAAAESEDDSLWAIIGAGCVVRSGATVTDCIAMCGAELRGRVAGQVVAGPHVLRAV